MAVANDIKAAEDQAIALIMRSFTQLLATDDPGSVAALLNKISAFNTLLTIIYRIEDQRAKRV